MNPELLTNFGRSDTDLALRRRRRFRPARLLVVSALMAMAAPAAYSAAPIIGGCLVFPPNNIWNVPVDTLPVHANSANFVASIGTNAGLHLDFGSGLYQGRPIGIPFTTVPAGQLLVPITFEVDDESDPGPYPIPPNPRCHPPASSVIMVCTRPPPTEARR